MEDNAIQVFSNNEFKVRTIESSGEIWFVAKDIAEVLEYERFDSNLLKNVPNTWKGTKRIRIRSENGVEQERDVLCLSEQGLYFFLGRSDKKKALPYQMWIAGDVVPSIRKTGSYSVNGDNVLPSGVLEGARLIFETAGITGNQAALALDKVYSSYTGRSALKAGEITLTAPTRNQLLTPTEIGKNFGLSSHRVNEILAGAGLQHKIYGGWEALPLGERYAVMVDVGKRHGRGTPVRQLKWDSSILAVFHTFMK